MDQYKAIVADPPWRFSDRGSRITPKYPLMSTDQIAELSIEALAAPDSLLFLWVPSAMISDGIRVARAWGFIEKQTVVWRKANGKVQIGFGKYFRNAHEIALVCARGRGSRVVRDHSIPSVFDAPRTRHSEKPEVFQDLVERLVSGPYLELFGRRFRKGWTVFGNELPNGGGEYEERGKK